MRNRHQSEGRQRELSASEKKPNLEMNQRRRNLS